MRHVVRALALVLAAATLSGCWLFGGPRKETAASKPTSLPEPKLCAAVRGNGNYILTHFTALARLAEQHGPFDGMAGGSSASITIFLYESMLKNPLLRSGADVGARLSLLLKSVEGYVDTLATQTDEALAIRGLAPIMERVRKDGIEALLDVSPLEAAVRLNAILGSDDLRALVNPEVFGMLTAGANVAHNAREVYTALSTAGQFSAADPSIFFRPGILHFPGLAEKIGRMGSFYAGYGPFDAAATGAWLDRCAPLAKGKLWPDVDPSCRQAFASLALSYRKAFVASESSRRSRIDDPIGTAFHALAITSVLTKGTAESFATNLARYRAGEPLQFTPSFADVRYGYFGAPQDLDGLEANPRGYTDLKTAKRLPLGQATWRLALALSPAEPGLARLQSFGEAPALVSAAGWPDLDPVQALKSIGCERVVYVTRKGEASKFARGVAKLLGATTEDEAALYDLDRETSSFRVALKEADVVWCTDWDRFEDAEVAAMAKEAYEAGPPAAPTRGCTP